MVKTRVHHLRIGKRQIKLPVIIQISCRKSGTNGYVKGHASFFTKEAQKSVLECLGIAVDEHYRVVDFESKHFTGDCQALNDDLQFGINGREDRRDK